MRIPTALMLGLILMFPISIFGQELQRLAILPVKNVSINLNSSPPTLESKCIDYYRNSPDRALRYWGEKGNQYDNVYSSEDVSVKINGKTSSKSFQSMVEGDNPLLILHAFIDGIQILTSIEINPNYILKKGESKIETIEIDFNKEVTIGNISTDRDTKQSQIIFDNWSSNISQDEYWQISKSLDVLEVNNLLTFSKGDILDSRSLTFCKSFQESKYSDPSSLPHKLFKKALDLNYIRINSEYELTAFSIKLLENLINYGDKLNTAYHMNILNQEPNYYDYYEEESLVEYQWNLERSQNIELTKTNKENESILDTLIKGSRFILGWAIKPSSFQSKYLAPSETGLKKYTSGDILFEKTIFFTLQSDIVEWANSNNIGAMDSEELILRLHQLLGLPPMSTNDQVVEIWVKESDMFRPKLDSTLNKTMNYSDLTVSYLEKIHQYSQGSYFNDEDNSLRMYPFLCNGRTFDILTGDLGIGELVLKENKSIYIRSITHAQNYFSNSILKKK